MEEHRPFRIALCIYEGLRLAFLVGAFMLLQPEGKIAFPWLAVITPGAMFALIALFWLLDMPRYRVYVPLYLAGKGLGAITAMFWIFFAKSNMIKGLFLQSHSVALLLVVPGIVFFLALGDALSAWLVNRILRENSPKEQKCE